MKMKPEAKDIWGKKKYCNFQGIENMHIGWIVYILRRLNLDSITTYWQ